MIRVIKEAQINGVLLYHNKCLRQILEAQEGGIKIGAKDVIALMAAVEKELIEDIENGKA